MRTFRRVCVYCGANPGVSPVYAEAARGFGAFLAGRGIGVVFGGGRVGLMGAVADGTLAVGGEVIGVIPEKLRDLELAHDGLTRLDVVDGMHTRKMRMADLSDAFVALPGGWGTLEEIFEVTTWTQLNYHHKPLGMLDVRGFYGHLTAFLDHVADEGFIRPLHRGLIQVSDDPATLLEQMATAEIPDLAKWIDQV